jgi:hypothetical protein
MKKTPLAHATEKFGDKAKLVAAVEAFAKGDDLWLGRTNEAKGLAHVSNSKLLRLHATFTTVKEKFGTRAKLISAICDLEKRKDEGYKTRLTAFPVPRLFDMYTSSKKRVDVATKKAAAPAPKKAPAAKKAPAKKAAAKK